jgi:L-ascorbate metabolism protein UlaG (beta-lactamase superfamily)
VLVMRTERFDEPLAQRLADARHAPREGEIVLYWLGQAGFVIDTAHARLLIDPYLSDTLAQKYRGTRFRHTRMMPAPIAPHEFDRVDRVLCTHRHTDHMDPGTLQPLAERFPALRFVVPEASLDEALKRTGASIERLIPVDAGQRVPLLDDCAVSPIASAHETLDIDEAGRHPWLGYVIEAHGVRLYHSGDCVPYPQLHARVTQARVDVALLPVNGRDAIRGSNGVPGNFTLDEAVELSRAAHIPSMIAHHHGLFDFNTLESEIIDARIAREAGALSIHRAQTGCAWRIGPSTRTDG